jgi:hypothetical protein
MWDSAIPQKPAFSGPNPEKRLRCEMKTGSLNKSAKCAIAQRVLPSPVFPVGPYVQSQEPYTLFIVNNDYINRLNWQWVNRLPSCFERWVREEAVLKWNTGLFWSDFCGKEVVPEEKNLFLNTTWNCRKRRCRQDAGTAGTGKVLPKKRN